MKKFTNFLYPKVKVFVNQHGSHAQPNHRKKIKKLPFVNQHGSHARRPVEEDKEGLSHDAEWHDGTPEGKHALEQLKHHYYKDQMGGAAFTQPDEEYHSPVEEHMHAIHMHMLANTGTPRGFHTAITNAHDYSHITPEHRSAIWRYTSSSAVLNHKLSNNGRLVWPEHQRTQLLDQAIAGTKHTLAGPLHTFHGTSFDVKEHLRTEPTLHSKGFLSSSTSSFAAHDFGTHILMLHAPGHHKSFPIKYDMSMSPHEKEVLHPRGMVLRPRAYLTTSRWQNGQYHGMRHYYHTDIEDVKPVEYNHEKKPPKVEE